jgi:hypothetical protein
LVYHNVAAGGVWGDVLAECSSGPHLEQVWDFRSFFTLAGKDIFLASGFPQRSQRIRADLTASSRLAAADPRITCARDDSR